MRFYANSEGEQIDLTDDIEQFAEQRTQAATGRLLDRLDALQSWEAEKLRTRDYGERHFGEFTATEGGDVGPGDPPPYVEPFGPTPDEMEAAELEAQEQ